MPAETLSPAQQAQRTLSYNMKLISQHELDGFGGIHPFTTPGHAMPPALNHTPYWPGWDIARGISVLPDGTGGYVVDAYGGAHPFGIGTHAPPPGPGPNAPYAAGEDWVRGFTFVAPMPASSGVGATSDRARRATGSTDARPATVRPRDPTPCGPASPGSTSGACRGSDPCRATRPRCSSR